MKANFRRILLLNKRTRYELEKKRISGLSDDKAEHILKLHGNDYEVIVHHHRLHKEFVRRLRSVLGRYDVDVHEVNRLDYNEDAVSWADLVIPAGGDGTFLIGASKITSREKPIVGFNTNPGRSEGFLCLPRHYSEHVQQAVDRILKGNYRELFRNRIEVTMNGTRVDEEPTILDHSPMYGQSLVVAKSDDVEQKMRSKTTRVLPHLALNEVFIGESLAFHVSYLDSHIPGTSPARIKCSGLCVSTGTGSTSWSLSMNRMPEHKVDKILQLAGTPKKPEEVRYITDAFNKSLRFPPDDKKMYFSFKDVIWTGVWPQPKNFLSDGFVESMSITSRCTAANLVIDASMGYPFNDGTNATLNVRPENALRTIVLD